jgi:hypothetical protein
MTAALGTTAALFNSTALDLSDVSLRGTERRLVAE